MAVVIAALSPLFARLRALPIRDARDARNPIGLTFARLSHHDGRPINDPVEKQRSVPAGAARGWARTARDSAAVAG
jgi:hypothetical protein